MFHVVKLIKNGLAIYAICNISPFVARSFYLHFKIIFITNKMTIQTINGFCKLVR